MKYVVRTLFLISCSSLWISCAKHTAYESFPELINEETGLREFRFRSADCVNTVYEHVLSNCDHQQEIISEKVPTSTVPKVTIRELTPDLKEKSKTVVSPTVQYDEKVGSLYISATMRINENLGQDFAEIKYSFEGDLKGFRDKFKSDPNLKYIPLVQKSGGQEKLNGIVYCSDRPQCHEIALVFSFLNPDENGNMIIDSKTFTIDSRESKKERTDTFPGQAVPKTLDLVIAKIEFPETYEVDDIANPENSALFANVKAPVLPQEPTGILCQGLSASVASLKCPDYVFDSTKPNPLHSKPDAEDQGPISVFSIDQEDTVPVSSQEEQSGLEDNSLQSENATVVENPVEIANPAPSESVVLEEENPVVQNIPRPRPRPDFPAEQVAAAIAQQEEKESVQLPQIAPRPMPRPAHIEELAKNTPPLVHHESPSGDSSSPSNGDDIKLPETAPIPMPRPTPQAAASSSIPSHERLTSVDGKFVFDLRKCATQLSSLRKGVFNQAKGIYFSGTLSDKAKQFKSSSSLNRPNADRKSKHFSSDLTHLTIDYAACVLGQKYTNVKIDIHDFSKSKGGKLPGHGSHQNGLDVDVSYPHIAGRTQGFDDFTKNLNNERVELALDYAKILYSTERVHIIFTDQKVINKFCQFMKSKNSLTKEYKDFINKNFSHVSGHKNHYHVRMKCNSQNEFCQPQNAFASSNSCS